MFEDLWETDREVAEAIGLEIERQNKKLELIASENFVSEAVLAAQGSPLTNKYAEGYPGKRYYGGCEYYDIIESLAVERARKLFGADHANVQPHAGAQANMAAYDALLEPGDVVLGMDLSHGGHLTHGSRVNFSGKLYEFHHYGVAQGTETIDYDEVLQIARRVKPRLIVAGASAYPRIIHFDRFREICDQVGALFMVDMAHIAGLVAVGLHPNPVEYADVVTTTTHKTLRGGRGGMILCREEYAKAIDKAVFPGLQGGPLMHAIAGKAVALKEASTPEFRAYQQQVIRNARQLAASLMDRGFRLVSGGTDNHLMLVDVKHRGMTGREAEQRLDSVGVTVNRNTIPFETEKPMVTSGIRLGTPALTSRGMKEEQMQTIAQVVEWALLGGESDRSRAQEAVRELCEQFPLYSGLREFFVSRGVVSA